MKTLIVLFTLLASTQADVVTLQWYPNPAGENISHYHLYRVHPLPRTRLLTTTQTRASFDATNGDRITITANNDFGESGDSAPWIVRLVHDPVVRVALQTSVNLQQWDEWQTFDMPESQARFFRLKISPP